MHKEQRKYPRIAATQLAAIQLADSPWWQLGRTLDLSLTGVALEVDADIPQGAAVVVALSLHDRVVLHGIAVRGPTDARHEVAVAFAASSRRYWKLLSLTFADRGPAPQADQAPRPGA